MDVIQNQTKVFFFNILIINTIKYIILSKKNQNIYIIWTSTFLTLDKFKLRIDIMAILEVIKNHFHEVKIHIAFFNARYL